MAVQDRLGPVFELFPKLRSVAAVMRMLNGRGPDLPRRDRHGGLHWACATVSAVATILKNPACAGTFVYGRTRMREASPDSRSPAKPKVARSFEEWRIVVKDRYTAHIDWLTYETVRIMASDTRAAYMRTRTRGIPRDGDLLLHGIVWCGRCGHRMARRGGDRPRCQNAGHGDRKTRTGWRNAGTPARPCKRKQARQ